METSGFRPDHHHHHHHHQSHVPQQSRRDKLRVQQVLSSTPIHLDTLPNSLDHHDHHHQHEFTPQQDHINNLHNARNNVRHQNSFLYDHQQAGIVSPDILDFSRNTARNAASAALTCPDQLGEGGDHRSMSISPGSDVPQSFMINWNRGLNPSNSVAAQSFENWPVAATNYASGSLALGCSSANDHVANSLKPNNIHFTQIASQDHVGVQKYYLDGMTNLGGDMAVGDQVVTVASTRDVIRSENELALLPFSFASLESATTHGQPNWATTAFGSAAAKKRDVDDGDQLRTAVVNDANLQGLSLSLSSINPQPQPVMPDMARHHHVITDRGSSDDSDQDSPKPKPVIQKPSIISKAANCGGKSLQDIVGVSSGSAAYRSNTGPLGPFTGYATILKSSRFLKPAQQLLEEFCGSRGGGLANKSINAGGDHVNSERLSGDVDASFSASALDHHAMDQGSCRDQHLVAANNNNNNNSCGSSSTFYGSNEMNNSSGGDQQCGVGSNVSFESGSSRPEHVQQKKAKLLYMQEEVAKRYKQYRQQMQMVVTSFESVAGLSSATPYISLALKAVSRHFRCLKSAIADQLNHTRRALGEDFPSPPATGTNSGADHTITASVRLKYMEQSFQKHTRPAGGPNVAFHEPQQHHIWRPQRGLPERSVAVLRAWLFEHFLHPYPTDTDKHMLATQTGLTRNQVSNWFINARVRVWKPMVEEIHTLETKGLTTDQGNNNKLGDGNIAPSSNEAHQAPSTKLNRSLMLLGADNDQHDEQSHEKRSRLECAHQAPTGLAGSVVQGFVPYHRGGLEVWSRAEQ